MDDAFSSPSNPPTEPSFSEDSHAQESSFSFIPVALGVTGIILGLIALFLSIHGSRKAGQSQTNITTTNAEIITMQETLVELTAEVESLTKELNASQIKLSNIDKQTRQLGQQTQSALNNVGKEMSVNRATLNEHNAALEKMSDILGKLRIPAASSPAIPVASSPPATPSPKAEEAPVPAAEVTEAATDIPETYAIQAGDNFGKLATRFGVTLTAILEANPGVDPRRLQIGQEIRLPSGSYE